jgi:hypothetical protein
MLQTMKRAKRSKAGTTKRSKSSSFFYDEAMALAEALANRRKVWGAEKISELADSVRDFASSVEAIPNLANFVNPAIESVEEFADYIKKTEFEQIIRDSATFARRHPIISTGSGVLAVLIAIQFLRSSGTEYKAAKPATKSARQARRRKKSSKSGLSKPNRSAMQAELRT